MSAGINLGEIVARHDLEIEKREGRLAELDEQSAGLAEELKFARAGAIIGSVSPDTVRELEQRIAANRDEETRTRDEIDALRQARQRAEGEAATAAKNRALEQVALPAAVDMVTELLRLEALLIEAGKTAKALAGSRNRYLSGIACLQVPDLGIAFGIQNSQIAEHVLATLAVASDEALPHTVISPKSGGVTGAVFLHQVGRALGLDETAPGFFARRFAAQAASILEGFGGRADLATMVREKLDEPAVQKPRKSKAA